MIEGGSVKLSEPSKVGLDIPKHLLLILGAEECPSHIHMLKSLSPVPQNVTVFTDGPLRRYLRQNEIIRVHPSPTLLVSF